MTNQPNNQPDKSTPPNVQVLPPNQVQAPYSLEAEQATLGACLLDPRMFALVSLRVESSAFFLKRHEFIFASMKRLYDEFGTFDFVTLTEDLKSQGVLEEIGGQSYLISLSNNTPSAIHGEVYAELTSRTDIRRRMLKATDEMRKIILDESLPVGKVIANAERLLDVATIDFNKRQSQHFVDVLEEIYQDIENPVQNTELAFPITSYRPSGAATPKPFKLKLAKGEQTLLCGISGTGKTALMLFLLLYYLRAGHNIVLVSMEMSKKKIVHRLVAQMVGISASDIATNRYPQAKKSEVIGALAELREYANQFVIADEAYSPSEIKKVVNQFQYTHPEIDAVFIDHLHRSVPDNKYLKGYQVWEANAKEFQAQAKHFNTPYLVLHQNKLPPDHSADKTPFGSHIYGGLSVLNVPDNVYTIHRDNHPDLGIDENQIVDGRVDIYELKDRNGGNNERRISGQLYYLGNERFTAWGG